MSKSGMINITLLYRKMMGEPLSGAEQQAFDAWYAESDEHRRYYRRFCLQQEKTMLREHSVIEVQQGLLRVKRKRYAKKYVIRWQWAGVAATVLILLAVGLRFFDEVETDVRENIPALAQSQPGKAAVTLRLGQGEQIILDSTLSMKTINKDCVSIHVENGRLKYDQGLMASEKMVYNELIVPPSGEYVVELTDGTKVYLNSASSLRFPAQFSGNERRVVLTGEAYFVVAKEERPFIVETRLEEIKVFGTEFNVMTYEDEAVAQTTLVKGSVGVCVKDADAAGFRKITPGEQFLLDRKTKRFEVVKVDVFPFIAWKDGLFVSQNDDLETILRKVSRWFDVSVFYQNAELKKKRFYGIMKRQTNLQDVLDVIAEAGDVRFKVDGRTVVVSDKK